MRTAIFSDVHGNLTALEAVLAAIEEEEVDDVVFAGDLCLFGPRPEACVDLVSNYEPAIACLHGNTDEWINGPPLLSRDIEEEERERWQRVDDVVSWTRERLPAADRAWLRELPFHRRVSPSVNPHDDLFVVHANPVDLEELIFPPEARQQEMYGEVRQSDAELARLLSNMVSNVLAFGHLHVPFIRHLGDYTLVNVSSVSMPGDGDPRAKYSLFTWEENTWTVEHRQVAYDVEEEIAAFRENRPPGWEESVAKLEAEGMVPQVV